MDADDHRTIAAKIIPLLPKDRSKAIDVLLYTLACTIVATGYTSTSVIKGLRDYVRMVRISDKMSETDLQEAGEWLQ